MAELLLALAELPLVLAAAWGLSTLLLPPGRDPAEDRSLTRVAVRLALGLGLVSYATLAAAAARVLHPAFFGGLLLAGIALLLRRLRPRPPAVERRVPRQPSLLAWVLAVFFAVNLFFALFPPTFYDTVLYHLGVPQYYLAHGGITAWPTHFNASLPLNGEMLFLFSLLGGTVLLPKLLSWAAAVALAGLLASWFRSVHPGRRALLPALLFFTVPQAGFLAASAKTDMLGFLFMAAAVYLLLDHDARGGNRLGPILSGLLWGCAVGTKVIFAFYLLAFLAARLVFGRGPMKRRVATSVIVGLLVLACLLPWFIKNAATMGNPVYPYLNRVFPSSHWSADQGRSFSTGLRRGADHALPDYLLFPFRLFLNPYRHGATAAWGILVLVLLPLLPFLREEGVSRILLTTAALAFLLLLGFAWVPRYYLPALLLLAWPLAAAVERAGEKIPRLRRPLTALIVILCLFQLLQQIDLQESYSQAGHFVLARLHPRRTAPLRYLDALPYYRAAEFINTRLGPADRVLILGEDRTFYIRRPFLMASFADRHPFIEALRTAGSPGDLARWTRREGLTHLLYSEKGLKRLGEMSPTHRLTAREKTLLESFLATLHPLYKDRRYTVYRLPEVT